MSAALVFFLGLVVWLATTIVVESELFRPLRGWFDDRTDDAMGAHADAWKVARQLHRIHALPTRETRLVRTTHRRMAAWSKARYVVSCHLCAGTWLALLLAAVIPDRLVDAPYGIAWLVTGLALKGMAHLVLEIVGALKKVGR